MMKNLTSGTLAVLLASLLPAAAAAAGTEAFEISRATSPIRVDGVLDEAAWQQATAIPVDHEWFPSDGVPGPVTTTALLTYDEDNLYVAFRAADPDPALIRARFADRDVPTDDDTVGFFIDPFHDGRRGFQFRINPLGVQMDAVNSDVEGSEDFSWDAIWESAARITAEGYLVEVALPFRQLRFPATSGVQTWGFIATRDWPRSLRHRMRSIVTDQDRNCLVCQFQELTGFQGMETGRNLEVTPTLTGNLSEERQEGGRFEPSAEDLEPGVSARWGVTPNVALNLTVNPDFSQVEADAAQLDVNTRFALFFPEKRPFFLEGADFFETQFPLVFTRTVADPVAGLKITGKQDAHAFGAFFAEDRINNLILPGNQGSGLASFDQDVTSGVLRYRRDLGATSTLGVLWTGREAEGYSNHVAGIDGLYRLSDSDVVRYQLAGSATRYPGSLASARPDPDEAGSFEDHGLSVAYQHNDRDWSWHADYQELAPGFRADSGFVTRVGVRSGEVWTERRIRGEQGGWFSNLYLFGSLDGTRDFDGAFNEWGSDLVLTYHGPRQSEVSLGIAPNQEHFEGITYHNTRQSISGSFQPTGGSTLSMQVRWGEDIDVANNRQGEFVTLAPGLDLRLGRRFQGGLDWIHQDFDVRGGRLFTVDLAQTRMSYHFNGRSFLRAILQYEWLERNPTLYNDPASVDRETEDLLTQLLFSYRLNAQTVFLLGYSDNHAADDRIDLTQTDRTVFLKIGYALLL